MTTIRNYLQHIDFGFDKFILFTIFALLVIGVIMNWMATTTTISVTSTGEFIRSVDSFGKVLSHLLKIAIGIGAAIMCYFMPLDIWRKRWMSIALISVSLVLFALTAAFGEEINGARRWLRIGGFQLSPSDVARFTLIIWLSAFLSEWKDRIHTFTLLLKVAGVVLLLTIPIILQPNLSTVMILFLIAAAMMWVSGIPKKYFAFVMIGITVIGAVYVSGSGFRSARSQVFMDPFEVYAKYETLSKTDPVAATSLKETSYQQRQSIIGFVQGGIAGVGYGNGRQKYFLPEAFNDCIIAIIGEEWGIIGIALILAAFGLLTWRGLRVMTHAPASFQYLLAFGIVINFLAYFFIHFYVNVSAMPSTGVPLPFISHGGTAMVFNLALVALLLRISCDAKSPLYPKAQ